MATLFYNLNSKCCPPSLETALRRPGRVSASCSDDAPGLGPSVVPGTCLPHEPMGAVALRWTSPSAKNIAVTNEGRQR